MSFGEKLKELRREKNVTQQELADYIGVGRASIAGYETKEKHPDFDKLRLISEFFNVTTDYLLEVERRIQPDEVEATIATHRVDYGEDLPKEARDELEEYINYLRFKYKK